MLRIFTRGNYFIIIEDNGIEYEGLKKDVLIRRLSETSDDFGFTNVNLFSPNRVVNIAEIQREDRSQYTTKDFLQFRNENLGGAGGGSVAIADGANLDAFSRLRVSQPTAVFDAQLTYNLQPTIFEQITVGSGATIAHDATNREALMTFAATPTGGAAYMQSFEHFRYQPLKSQLVAVTFNFKTAVENVLKFAGYSDRVNGIEFQNNGEVNQFAILSGTDVGSQVVTQGDWNLDKLDGQGRSGILFDISKTQILIIDFQALYVGRVRVGFDIDGRIIYCHEFLHANEVTQPYIQSANLPIVCGMVCTGTVSTTMNFVCSAVASEGGQEITSSFDFTQDATVVAGNNTNTHLLSIRPKLLFNGITNRVRFGFISLNIVVIGARPVQWYLVLGQALTAPSFADVNDVYSAAEYDRTGTLNGAAAIVVQSGFVAATQQSRGEASSNINSRFPITLSAAGGHRDLGTLTLIVKGLGGTSELYGCINWLEIR